MTTDTTALADDDCYRALKAKDARFDGRFFTGVTSTGIYCRPVCRVQTPRRENCRFFAHAAQAEQAGFRPCLRCRPELAPHSVRWSIQDAAYLLAHQAARLLDEPEAWGDATPSVARLAVRLGVSERHVRRIFEAQFGVSPLQYLQTRRLLTAKQLLADTNLPITQVALISGFASVRRFNAAFLAHYQLNPTQLRRQGARPEDGGITVRLGYRPPYDVAAMLGFFSKRSIDAIEFVALDAGQPCAGRTFRVESGGKVHAGWLRACFDEARSQLVLQVSDSLREALPLVIRRVRAMFDLDADPAAINSVLHGSFPSGDGLRVPGTLDGYELAVRAVLGQQITVAAARTLAQRMVDRLGEPIETPWPRLSRLFPDPAALAAASGDALGQLGIVKQRQAAIVGIARAVADRRLQLHGGADVNATIALLKELPGIGDWTAQYIAMRALRWPDAFPAGDVALHKMLGLQALKTPAKAAEKASLAWKPWRSYAVIRAWSGLLAAAPPPKSPESLPKK
ncbi:DNA-3-methyladenine glycosylase 2 family protein [Polaromonas sp.]|jgi:AraC family transcriptional regulator of adaptative response / DNA-3-methyladenine glycosylase II|uniref:DNA-3-methyladenine glycosylase 2 family protein n=1 Tax=Polaromonas sp. TaxID=1869339 RepID=UPI001D34D1F5|nr:DNA-3-methyladenine glycosylase 2 family protein [Polaromonas sp.]MBT9476195.1 helix-turn-helix domain-containing protein [Polaromonas sp.]